MKTRKIVTALMLGAFLLLALSACAPSRPGPQVWIDFPTDGALIPPASPVEIVSHASARDGVAEILLSVNGNPYRRDIPANAGESFVSVRQPWEPLEEGAYVLEVFAYTSTGEMSAAASVNVRVGDVIVVEDERIPIPGPSEVPTLVPTSTATATPLTPEVPITVTPTITPTKTPTVYQDTTAPPIPTPMVPADGLVIDCTSSQNLVWLPVEDPSGIAGYYIRLEFEQTAGNWVSVDNYGPIVGKQLAVDVDCGLIYRWSVQAKDGAGNFSGWSMWSGFSVSLD